MSTKSLCFYQHDWPLRYSFICKLAIISSCCKLFIRNPVFICIHHVCILLNKLKYGLNKLFIKDYLIVFFKHHSFEKALLFTSTANVKRPSVATYFVVPSHNVGDNLCWYLRYILSPQSMYCRQDNFFTMHILFS